MRVRNSVVIVMFGLVATLWASAQSNPKASEAIRKADQDWMTVFSAKDVDKSLAFFAADGAMMAPNAPAAQGQAIRTALSGFFQLPELKISWTPTTVEAAKSGDLGFSSGTYQMTFRDPSGKTVPDKGKYVTVWQKQPDGSWKVLRDIFNTDMPAPAQ